MAARTPRPRWLPGLLEAIEHSGRKVFSARELGTFIDGERIDLQIPLSVTLAKVTAALLENGRLRKVELRREGTRSTADAKRRFVWGNPSDYAVGLSLAKGSYLSHASALFLHALTEQVPKTIYVNREQAPKRRGSGVLSQAAIDRAFSNSPRTSQYAFVSSTARYVLLSGKQTGRLEVSQMQWAAGELLHVTKLERTLIDIVVRPSYAGGVYEVLRAYQAAAQRTSVNTLLAVLKKLDYIYPYHQSLGFFMERAGFSDKQLQKIESLGIRWDFYADYKIQDRAFDKRWRLCYPKGL